MGLNAFVIRPFGTKDVALPGENRVIEGQPVRVSRLTSVDFDAIDRELITPALAQLGIAAKTTEAVVEAGNIREDMFHLLMTADLVVADVTVHNPNVFYELGIRHAFRDKFTFLIRSAGNEYPFDLKTDRYFEYDHLKPAESREKLAQAVRATLASERADSPVFRLLPRMRAEDRSRFISVPRDFLEDVERAKQHRRGGDLRLLAAECEGFLWEVEGLREVGRAQFDLNFIGGSRATWEQIAKRYPDDVEANMVLSTIYLRMSDATRSEQALARISRLNIPDVNTAVEIRALVGRNLKSQWMQSWQSADPSERRRQALRSPLLRRAREAYADAFRGNLNSAYAGLSALSLMLTEVSLGDAFPETWVVLADRPEEAAEVMAQCRREISRLTASLEYAIDAERRRLASQNRVDFWFETMEAAFLCLTSTNPKKVEQAYLEALQSAPRYAEASMRRALELYQQLGIVHPDARVDLQRNAATALDVMRREESQRAKGNIVMFVGLRIAPAQAAQSSGSAGAADRTAANDEPMRFLPPSLERRAKAEIRRALEREREQGSILFGMAAASHGTDILFHEVCDELALPSRAYLALPRDQYVGEYVAPAGARWVERFEGLYRSRRERERDVAATDVDYETIVNVMADSIEMPRWLQSKSRYTVGKRNAFWMLQHALVQRHLHSDEGASVTLIALWDRRELGKGAGIAGLVASAEKSGIKVVHVDCSQWRADDQVGLDVPTAHTVRPPSRMARPHAHEGGDSFQPAALHAVAPTVRGSGRGNGKARATAGR